VQSSGKTKKKGSKWFWGGGSKKNDTPAGTLAPLTAAAARANAAPSWQVAGYDTSV